MKMARWVFLLAGLYGLLVLSPNYFLRERLGADYPPPITHPEYFYGFLGVAIAWQIAFLLISRDPLSYRPLMLVAIVEKLGFAIPTAVLFGRGELALPTFIFGMIDLTLGCLFAVAYWRTGACRASA